MKKILKPVLIIIALFFLSGCQHLEPSVVIINDNILNIEVAKTVIAKSKGLSGRENLCSGCGMLFEFSDYQTRNFWMKEMNFSLDIIWIKDDQVIGYDENVQPITNGEITRVRSPEPVNYVLEVNAGWVANHQIRAGDTVVYQ